MWNIRSFSWKMSFDSVSMPQLPVCAYAIVFPVKGGNSFLSLRVRMGRCFCQLVLSKSNIYPNLLWKIGRWIMGYQLGSRLEQNGSTLWHRCLQPKSLHCETEEDVGLVVTIGFHQMGGPWRKKEPWKRAWGLLCELQRHLSNQPGLPVLVYACDNHNRSKGERREKYQDMIRNHRNGNTERSWTVADEQQPPLKHRQYLLSFGCHGTHRPAWMPEPRSQRKLTWRAETLFESLCMVLSFIMFQKNFLALLLRSPVTKARYMSPEFCFNPTSQHWMVANVNHGMVIHHIPHQLFFLPSHGSHGIRQASWVYFRPKGGLIPLGSSMAIRWLSKPHLEKARWNDANNHSRKCQQKES